MKENKPTLAAELRRRAEERLAAQKTEGASGAPREAADDRRLVHELEVHQIELEIQNEELRAARQETEASLERYTELYDFAPLGYAVLAENGTIVELNLTGARFLGVERAKLMGRRFDSLVSDDERAAFGSFFVRVLDGADESHKSCELGLHGPARKFHARLTAAILQRPERSILLCIEDVTERKAQERRLAYLASFPQKSPNPIIEADLDGQVRYANPAALRLFPDVRALGRAHPWLSGWEILALSIRDAEAPHARVVTVGDMSFFQLLHFEPVEQVIRIYGIDMTERQVAEEALREANRRLREADRSKNEFLAVLSHELRNPLTPIRHSAYVLERAAPGGQQAKRALAVIDRQAGQLTRLVDDLLDVTRITRNKIHLQRETVELNELVRHTMEDQRSLFEKAEVHLELHPAPSPVFVSADWNRLAQAVGNLLQNAAKFTSQGGTTSIVIHVDSAASRAVIHVVDNGVGIAPEMVERVFEPFSQADSTLNRSKGGLGLGLALVKGLVELHGGDVTAHSAGHGKGAEFVVRLPVAIPKAAIAAHGDRSTAGRKRVLVIEDNIDAADTLREVLEFGEHEVEVAYNGLDGLAKARTFRPDVVLCDIGLPGMDGYEVARAFRADGALKHAHLIAVSGYALPEDLQRAQAAGFEQHLAKPPRLNDLEQTLASLS